MPKNSYYSCKECDSDGSIKSYCNPKCPVCGSKYLKIYSSQYDFIKIGGKRYEKCNEA